MLEFKYTGYPQNISLNKGCYHVVAAGAAGYGSTYSKDVSIGIGGAGGLSFGDFCLKYKIHPFQNH